MPTLPPPKRVPLPPPATAPEAAAPTEAPADPAPAAPADTAPAAEAAAPSAAPRKLRKAAPKKAPPAKKAAPVKKAPTKAAPKKVPTKTIAKASPKPATENVVPKVPKVKTRIWSDEAVELGTIIVCMKKVVPALSKKRVELRAVPDRLQVMFNEKLGLPCQACYTTPDHVGKIVKFLTRVPEELLPFKWPNAFARIEKFLDKLK